MQLWGPFIIREALCWEDLHPGHLPGPLMRLDLKWELQFGVLKWFTRWLPWWTCQVCFSSCHSLIALGTRLTNEFNKHSIGMEWNEKTQNISIKTHIPVYMWWQWRKERNTKTGIRNDVAEHRKTGTDMKISWNGCYSITSTRRWTGEEKTKKLNILLVFVPLETFDCIQQFLKGYKKSLFF